jgi:hypothetical protein
MSPRAALIQWSSNRRTARAVPSASTSVFAASSIQKPKCSSTVDELLPLVVSTITRFFLILGVSGFVVISITLWQWDLELIVLL